MTKQCFYRAKELINKVNSEDPNREISERENWPKELLYSRRMLDMLERYAPDADDAMKLAVSAQHIQRWKLPRSDYPMDRKGYHQWRTRLRTFHADTVARLLTKAGYENTFITRVTQAVSKKSLKKNPDTQLLEDVASLVFIEYYMLDFVGKHPEYDEQKWIDIIRRIWDKMSIRAQQYAFSEHIKLPHPLTTLIEKAILD